MIRASYFNLIILALRTLYLEKHIEKRELDAIDPVSHPSRDFPYGKACRPNVYMAVKFKVTDIKIILLQLLICLVTFYGVYYAVGSICFETFRLDTFDVLIPFDFKTEPSWLSKRYLVNLVSTEVTFFTCGLLFAGVVKEWVWDYAITITLVHIAVTSAVMAEFPCVWHWWLAVGCGLLIMICSGQLLAHFAFKDNTVHPLLEDF
eukprot:gi/632962759/ref/XP_007897498.1/ PREDICTED: transmembrane protein 244 [Callorhinchus milii]